MVSRIWQFSGSIRLSFWLLVTGAAILFAGSLYTNVYFSFFRTLSQTPVQTWLSIHLSSSPHLVWWIPVLFIIMGCLGINIIACALQRITQLVSQKDKVPLIHFMHMLTPSIIHFLFFLVLAGHLVTFTMGNWQRTPIRKGDKITIIEKSPALDVIAITNSHYPENSAMNNRISQTKVEVSNAMGRIYTLEHGSPVKIEQHFLYLDMVKKKFKGNVPKPMAAIDDGENCNQAPVYHTEKNQTHQPKLLLLAVRDPGLYLISLGLSAILVLMTWYFCYPIFKKKS